MESADRPEGATPAAGGEPAATPVGSAGKVLPKRRVSERRVKVIGLVAVVAVVVIILLWGMVPAKILEIREVVGQASAMDGDEVSVKGIVTVWEPQSTNFTLTDPSDPALALLVTHHGAIPEGFGLNVTAVVKGTFHKDGTTYRFESDEIQIGCPSKY